MALYRCAACGSPGVVKDTQKEGYDYVKGAIGTAVFGVGGAVAGINAKTKQVYKCPDCGITLNDPMPEEIKMLIDIGVMSPQSRKNLKLGNTPMEWKVLTTKYKNIEKDAVDTQEHSTDNNAGKIRSSVYAVQTITPEEREKNRRAYESARTNYVKACSQWAEECRKCNMSTEDRLREALEKERAALVTSITGTRDFTIKQYSVKKERYAKEKSDAAEKLSALGFFQFGEKQKIKQQMAELAQRILDADKAINEAQQTYKNEMAHVDEDMKEIRAEISKSVQKKSRPPKKPSMPEEMIKFYKDGELVPKMDVVHSTLNEMVFRYIEQKGTATFSQIKNDIPALFGLTDGYIRGRLRQLKDAGEITEADNSYSVNYSYTPK